MITQESQNVKVSDETKIKLDKLKIIRQEPYDSVISRLIDLKNQFDKKVKR